MSFVLKNIRATYQCLVNTIFTSQISRNVEVYVDDMVRKSTNDITMIRDIEETFKTLETSQINLNLTKCKFGAKNDNSWDTTLLETKYSPICPRFRTY